MVMATPGWQTDDLVEEWVESSPSPPPSSLPRPLVTATTNTTKSTLPRNIGSIQAKRGSLRGLGHAPARGLPTSRNGSMEQSKPLVKRNGSGLLSPPSSGPEDEVDAAGGGGAGTCVVKDGVDDDRGKHLIRNQSKGKDIFGALPLERMFVPPSPPIVPASSSVHRPPSPTREAPAAPSPEPSLPAASPSMAYPANSSSSSTHDTPFPRRVSHQYAPLQPSRLSKSITPSNVSTSFTSSAPPTEAHTRDVQPDDSLLQDDTAPQVEQTTEIYALAQSTTPDTSPTRADQSGEVPQGEFSFVYEPPSQVRSNVSLGDDSLEDADEVEQLEGRQPTFDPSEISHSTVHGGRTQQPGLRLFRSTYDTYTREHLSALVDSIAIEQSPSQGSPGRSREQTPGASDHHSAEGSGSGSGSAGSVDTRSSKRLRLSPPSPPKRAPMRDWGAQGMRMMDKIRDIGPGSTTSASRSRTSEEDQRTGKLRLGSPTVPWRQAHDPDVEPTIDYRQSPSLSRSPTPEPVVPNKTDRPTHRSNPSTTSSGYLRAAEDLMARIKNRGVSESGSNPDSPASRMRQILSETDDNAFASSEADTDGTSDKAPAQVKVKPRSGPSPRRILRRLSASEEIKRVTEGASDSESGDDHAGDSSQKQAAFDSHRSLANGVPAHAQLRHGFDADDLNRYVSSSTHPTTTNTGTTISTSFVKHKGRPPPPSPANIRMIRPDDVQGMLANRVGKMRYDQTTMRWVRELGTVDENGESRRESEESEDVFAGMESWRDEVRSLRQDMEQEAHQDEQPLGKRISADRSNSRRILCEDPLELSDETSSPSFEPAPAPRLFPNPPSISPPARPAPHHASSAPPVLTPRPGSSSPPKLRSALRQPNSSTPFHNGQKKRAGWHSDLTPAPARGFSQTPGGSSGARRSVSFSDGKKNGKIDGPEVVLVANQARRSDVPADDFFKSRQRVMDEQSQAEQSGEISWMPSARTKRIQGLLEDMEDLSIDDAATPSKPPKQDMSMRTLPTREEPAAHSEEEDDTAPIIPFRRSTRSRANDTMANGNATFLTECSFGVAHDKLVQLITDVQPFEPYWETLKSIDLRNRGVDSLTRLKEFLPALQEVLLDGNRLSYLSGLPSSVLNLHVANNKLSSLTSVAHLKRIEILDISNNQLDSVYQLECLKHLKELKADGNAITDLSGIAAIEGLVSLSVANNRIESLNLSRTKWASLEMLIASGNQITEVHGLDSLESLRTVDLDNNKLTSFASSSSLTTMRTLRISDNHLSSLDMSNFPKLRTLYADGNRLSRLSRSGHENSRVENLSLRNQRCSTIRLSSPELAPVKRLYVSGNALPADFFPTSLPNLLYLEAAACSLSTLPASFTTALPNLKILNLNYNFLTTLDGLSGLQRLRKLTVVGCRLGGKEKGLVRSLKGLTGLEELDLRMNPSTLSFYLPLFAHHSPASSGTEAEDTLPRDKSYIQPSTRLQASANRRIRDAAALTKPTQAEWSELDGQFRKSLPDEWYGRRLLYRGLVMRACSEVEKLDGLEVTDGERRKADELLRRAGI